MILDQLWRAERRAKKKKKHLRELYHPLLKAAEKEKNEPKHQSLLDELHFEFDLLDEPECIRTERLVKRARKVGIPVRPQPYPLDEDAWNNDYWVMNSTTWNFYLTDRAQLELTREVRKGEVERLQHRMRLVNQIIIPFIGFIGAMMGLISLLHSLGLI